ncbi:MAG: hypothetical protein WCF84_02300 [Anaerolineae bacterium]
MKPKGQQPDANEWGKLRSFLAQQKMSQQQIKDAVGQQVNGRTRAQIAQELKNWLSLAPKG